MRKEDEQAMRRTFALLKMKCQEQKECPTCPLCKLVQFDGGSHNGCILDMPPTFMNVDDIIECFM